MGDEVAATITGTWKNELGSTVRLIAGPLNEETQVGLLTGEYLTAAGDVKLRHPIFGSWVPIAEYNGLDEQDVDGEAALAWTVDWVRRLPGSTPGQNITAWSGQLIKKGDAWTVCTHWTLTKKTSAKDEWGSTRTGSNFFHKLD